jgi:predicted ArsR family transcriptional regulator
MALREMTDLLEDASVEQAVRAGWTWSQVAEALGVTRQAVHKKHLGRLIAAGIDLRRRNA